MQISVKQFEGYFNQIVLDVQIQKIYFPHILCQGVAGGCGLKNQGVNKKMEDSENRASNRSKRSPWDNGEENPQLKAMALGPRQLTSEREGWGEDFSRR